MFDELLQPFYSLQKNPRFTLGVLITLSLLLGMTFISTVNDWRHDFASVEPKPISNMQFFAEEASARLVTDLPNQHLFGQSAADDFLPITSLQVHLTGIIKDSNSERSQAIISEASQTGKIYRIGDELVAGIKIYAINDDGVVLEHAGHLEKLPLVRAQLHFEDRPRSLWADSAIE